ncbi:hypothetical protein WR25_02920 [Diploscapter pachys]|uniref:F-box domain-containing protein n=1 Tax=Diploscapter pachys TaxID=2018661 RepID=A0A2A2JGC6_9BILA|nr:hypothetical protein WR25_02920 [Diploscapter pachys]
MLFSDSGLPTEIVEEVLQYCALRDRINMARASRRVYDIGHSQRSSLRFQLNGTTSSIRLELSSEDMRDGIINRPEKCTTHNLYTANIQCYRRVFIDAVSHMDVIMISFVVKCCQRHIDLDGLDGRLFKNPNQFVKYNCKSNSECYQFNFLSLEDAMNSVQRYLFYFSNVHSAVKSFHLFIYNTLTMWHLLADFFDQVEITLNKPTINLNLCYIIENSRFYNSRLFANGIKQIKYVSNLGEDEHGNLLSRYDELMTEPFYKARFVEFMVNASYDITDDVLVRFEGNERLRINYTRFVTAKGIARYLQKIFTTQQKYPLDVKINTNAYFSLKDIVEEISEEFKFEMDEENERTAKFTNKFEQTFKIDVNHGEIILKSNGE